MRTFSLRRPADDAVARALSREAASGLSYPEVGATQGPLPQRYHHGAWELDLGDDVDGRFERARACLAHWDLQRGAGMRVVPDEPVREGMTFMLAMHLGVVHVLAAGRVVYVIDEPDRYTFAYGTLAAHPERGEEAFTVERHGGRVRFGIRAFSRPSHPLARLGSPVASWVQRRVTRTYLEAMRRAVG